MRGAFFWGAVVGAAATTLVLSRKNSNVNMARMGTMVSNAIGDGFKMMTSNSNRSASGSANDKQHTDHKANVDELHHMISKDASVQKQVNDILTQNSH